MYKNYLLNACALIPKFDHFNNPYTIIVTSKGYERVNLTPSQLIDNDLKENGSSLKGAKEATKAILGTASVPPILIPRLPFSHIWFPTESIRNKYCHYFALHHVLKVEKVPFSSDKAVVLLRDKRNVEVPISRSKFLQRWNKASSYFAKDFFNQYISQTRYLKAEEKLLMKCAEENENYFID
mgnify:CR=1 FL=1